MVVEQKQIKIINAYLDAGVDIKLVNSMTMCYGTGVYENEDGTLCRNAVGTGKRLAADYTALYVKNNVKLPDCKGYALELSQKALPISLRAKTTRLTLWIPSCSRAVMAASTSAVPMPRLR